MSEDRVIYKGRRVPLVLSELARVTKERDELAQAFIETYDALWVGEDGRHWGLDNPALHALRERLKKDATSSNGNGNGNGSGVS